MKFALPARLDDGVVALRPMRPDDAAAYAGAFRDDPALGRLLGIEQDPDVEAVLEQIERNPDPTEDDVRFFTLAIADAATDAFWGEVIVHSLHDRHRRGEVGFWVVSAQRRRGIGTRAVALIISWLFDALDLDRVEMTTTPENPGVPALASRLGFGYEGTLRSRNFERGQRVDILWFGLLRDEWRGNK